MDSLYVYGAHNCSTRGVSRPRNRITLRLNVEDSNDDDDGDDGDGDDGDDGDDDDDDDNDDDDDDDDDDAPLAHPIKETNPTDD